MERYCGEVEPLDSRKGHIPNAHQHSYKLHLNPDQTFKDKKSLRQIVSEAQNGRAPADIISSCGSGVTACHLLFVMDYLGLPGARLYPGSYSEWSQDPARPVVTGPHPNAQPK
jgi:thiosulfate/3-mercaptopyruvate sulfurtransferase